MVAIGPSESPARRLPLSLLLGKLPILCVHMGLYLRLRLVDLHNVLHRLRRLGGRVSHACDSQGSGRRIVKNHLAAPSVESDFSQIPVRNASRVAGVSELQQPVLAGLWDSLLQLVVKPVMGIVWMAWVVAGVAMTPGRDVVCLRIWGCRCRRIGVEPLPWVGQRVVYLAGVMFDDIDTS